MTKNLYAFAKLTDSYNKLVTAKATVGADHESFSDIETAIYATKRAMDSIEAEAGWSTEDAE